jgi:hypothetical protein
MYKSQSVYRPSPEVLQELYGKFSILPITHLALICKACAKSESLLFAQLVADSFSARDDYRPEDKAILVKYLSSIPKLIVVLDRKDWLDVSDPVVLKAWKEAERNSHEGVLDTVGYRFAAMGARRGLKEGLLALAESVQGRARQSASPMRDAGLKTDTGVLRMLFPSDLEGAALGEFVLKNKKTISYDATKRSYALKS